MTRSASQRKQRPSMDDVAAVAGVSKAAVSKVIRNAYGVSPAMRTRVESAIDALGYRPSIAAQSMRGASYTIGVEIPQVGNDFFTQVVQGAAEELAESRYQLIIAPASGNLKGETILGSLVDRQVDGLVAISPDVSPEWLEGLALNVPVVLLGRHDRSENYDCITNDDRQGAGMVMDHLLGLGHEDIAHITVEVFAGVPARSFPHVIRREVYETSMRERSLPLRTHVCRPSEMDAYRVCLEIMSGPRPPTAIFAANDTLAIGALRARTELDLGPTELSVVGYDGIDLASHPIMGLTTVDQFGHETGRRAMRLLLERIQDGRTEARHDQMDPQLRVRRSTAPPGRAAQDD